mgnify:CR=1 FL=1
MAGPSMDAIGEIIANAGYEIVKEEQNLLQLRDLESGISISCVLEEDILFMTVSCMIVESSSVSAKLMKTMLDAENGIPTSSFQIYDLGGGKQAITLNNFAKLQDLGEDDRDDVLSCISFLIGDVCEAKDLLGGII